MPTASKAFIDFQHDVCAKDIRLAVREACTPSEHIKRFTTNGMASDQGKMSNMHGLAIASEAPWTGSAELVYHLSAHLATPVTFGTLVGHSRGKLFDPARKTPMHALEEAEGAAFRGCRQLEARLVLSACG